MKKTISTAEARKRFAEITDDVRQFGQTYSIVRHGKEVARLVPPTAHISGDEQDFVLAVTQFVEQYDDALSALAKR